jgi:hypothetical protein
VFKRGRSTKEQVQLPDARKALAERYTIDAEEAEARAQHGSEGREQPNEAENRAQRVLTERARRQAAERLARRVAEERERREEVALRLVPEPEPVARIVAEPEPEIQTVEAGLETVVAPPAPEPAVAPAPAAVHVPEPAPEPEPAWEPNETTEDLPLMRWLQGVDPGSPATAEWARELVKAREARTEDRRLA